MPNTSSFAVTPLPGSGPALAVAHIAIVDADPEYAAHAAAMLRRHDPAVVLTQAATLEHGLNASAGADGAIVSMDLPDTGGLEAVLRFTEQLPQVALIVRVADGDEGVGIAALALGAQDYLSDDGGDPGALYRRLVHARTRKQVEVELRATRGQLRGKIDELARTNDEIFRLSFSGMVQVDAAGTIVAANAAATRLLDRPTGQVVGSRVADLFDDDAPDGRDTTLVLSHTFADRHAVERTGRFARSDGSERLAAFQYLPVAGALDEGDRVLIGFTDRTEERARALQDVHHKALEDLGRLAAGVAHEIRGPLQFVTTSARFLEDSLERLVFDGPSLFDPHLVDEMRLAHGEISEGLTRVRDIVTGINAVASRAREREELPIADLLRFPVAIARGLAAPGVGLVLRGETSLGIRVHPGLFQQALLNLLLNAVHAIEGTMGARPNHAHRVELYVSREADGLCIDVRDDGPGLEEDVAARAFEPFFSTKTVGSGTGQGLAIVRQIVEQHGGTVVIGNRLEADGSVAGAVASIRLPLEVVAGH